jgi:hypothetical protein
VGRLLIDIDARIDATILVVTLNSNIARDGARPHGACCSGLPSTITATCPSVLCAPKRQAAKAHLRNTLSKVKGLVGARTDELHEELIADV